eukprot:jgi/Botrbrau1/13744/Bobra.0056s0001.1
MSPARSWRWWWSTSKRMKRKYRREASRNPKKSEKWLKEFDAEFVNVDQSTLFELILAANYMDCKDILDLTCLTVANMMKGKSAEEVRKRFHIKNDYSPEEEDEVRRANQWAFE